MKKLISAILFLMFASSVHATTYPAASCNTTDVASAISAATTAGGGTVTIPTCPSGVSWTSGVSWSSAVNVQGAGSGRIIAYDNGIEVLTVGTGTLTVTLAGYSPNFSASSISNGETLRVFENNARTNWMQGTVTSLVGNTLTMNITSTGGSGSTHRWLVATVPQTVIINNSNTTLFAITENTSIDINLSGIKIAQGTGTGDGVTFNAAAGGQAIVFHDSWIEQGTGDSVWTGDNKGLVYNVSFDSSPFSTAPLAVHLQPYDAAAWQTASYWGTLDTTGQHNFYVEACDFHAYLNAADNDEAARSVFRYSLFDNAGFGTHGQDTSPFGQRYFEYYQNTGVYNGYSDGSTWNMNWWWFVRGGTYVIWGNTMPALVSQDYGTKADANMTVMNLQRDTGLASSCWGQGFSTPGQYYPSIHQVGLGYVTGAGTVTYPHNGFNNSSTYIPGDGYTTPNYVGDSEPAYAWGNSRQPLGNMQISDYSNGNSDSCAVQQPGVGTTDTSANYIVLNRDYYNGSTAKPGYAPYPYPHPLENQNPPPTIPTGKLPLTLTVNPAPITPPSITTTSPLPGGTVVVAYSVTFTGANGKTPYTWTATGLPAGFTLSSAGVLSASSPPTAGTFSFQITLVDSESPAKSTSGTFSLTIAAGTPVITAPTIPVITVGTPLSLTFSATGCASVCVWGSTGSLPPGITFVNGVLAGTPTVSGTYSFTLTVQ